MFTFFKHNVDFFSKFKKQKPLSEIPQGQKVKCISVISFRCRSSRSIDCNITVISCRWLSTAPSHPTWPSLKHHRSLASGRTAGPTLCLDWASPQSSSCPRWAQKKFHRRVKCHAGWRGRSRIWSAINWSVNADLCKGSEVVYSKTGEKEIKQVQFFKEKHIKEQSLKSNSE